MVTLSPALLIERAGGTQEHTVGGPGYRPVRVGDGDSDGEGGRLPNAGAITQVNVGAYTCTRPGSPFGMPYSAETFGVV